MPSKKGSAPRGGRKKVRVGIIGVGNCASSLIQGVHYYHDAKDSDRVPGLMHVNLGGYHVRDLEFVAAFDVDAEKVGVDLETTVDRDVVDRITHFSRSDGITTRKLVIAHARENPMRVEFATEKGSRMRRGDLAGLTPSIPPSGHGRFRAAASGFSTAQRSVNGFSGKRPVGAGACAALIMSIRARSALGTCRRPG